jgi:hypothetical protein
MIAAWFQGVVFVLSGLSNIRWKKLQQGKVKDISYDHKLKKEKTALKLPRKIVCGINLNRLFKSP